MLKGYMGKILWVDLPTGKIEEEVPDESLYRDFIGGYGTGSRILYDRMKAGIDPMGPENIFGIITGPLTGTPTVSGTRYAAVAKSPLTGGWGDANSGGHFGPYLKFAGYDAVFFTGISDKPVYLLIDDGKAELKDASHLWGRDAYYTEETLEAEYGSKSKVICIGPAAEKLSYIGSIMTHKGDSAARGGMGAVMGSKKIKAIVARGEREVPIADLEKANALRKEHIEELQGTGFLEKFGKYGTGGHGDTSAHSGDTPVKNWGGVGVIDVPDVSGLHRDLVIANLDKRIGCWHCPAVCKGSLKEGKGEYKYPAGTHRLEYETMGALGANCANTNLESMNMANHLCNYYGMDTISAGTIISFAMECYENGIITKADTDGIELNWGNHRGLVAMIEKMGKREGFGDVLADGVKIAAEKIGKGAEEYAVHIGGQEVGMHDPRIAFHQFAGMPSPAMYWLSPTPGRHTQAFGPPSFINNLNNAMGVCIIIFDQKLPKGPYAPKMMAAVTGLERSMEELLKAGERIANMRHAFNLREGLNPLEHYIHGRVVGRPPLKEGPLADVSPDLEEEGWWYLGALDWDKKTTVPSKEKLLELGLNDIAEQLWPPEKMPGNGPPPPESKE